MSSSKFMTDVHVGLSNVFKDFLLKDGKILEAHLAKLLVWYCYNVVQLDKVLRTLTVQNRGVCRNPLRGGCAEGGIHNRTRSVRLGGSGGMPPQENFGFQAF